MRTVLIFALFLVFIISGLPIDQVGAAPNSLPDPSTYPLLGIDVSHHQGKIDWTKVAAAGTAFAYIKSTEGRDFTDRRFAYNWSASKAAGLPRGAYHFFTFCSSGIEQAAHFLGVAPPDPQALPPVVDVEFVGNCTSYGEVKSIRTELRQFLSAIERAWNRRPILYVTSESYERILDGKFQSYPIWIRSLISEPPLDSYGGWLIWQFSGSGRIPGISGPVDRNALRPGRSLESLSVNLSK